MRSSNLSKLETPTRLLWALKVRLEIQVFYILDNFDKMGLFYRRCFALGEGLFAFLIPPRNWRGFSIVGGERPIWGFMAFGR